MELNEDQFILDLIKAQNTYAGDPSHGGKLVKKQIIDKNGKKQTEWVRPADFNKPVDKDKKQDQPKDQSNNSEDEKPNTDFIDNLGNEDKAKLELIKEMIDAGDHINAKQLADGLSDEVKHFIPKDVWKQMHEQDQIENNGVKVEGEREKFLSSLIKPEDIKAAIRNFSQALDKYDTSNAKIANVKLSKLKPTQQGEDRINSSSIEEAKNMRELVSGDRDVEDMRKEDLYPIIVDSKTNEILDGNHRYSAYEMNGYKTIPTIFVTPKTEDKKDKIKKSQMNIFQQGKQLINKAIDNVKDFFNPSTTIEEFADVIVFNENFEILLLKRANGIKIEPNKWWLPGGHMGLNEEPVVTAYRELQEETAITHDINEFNKIDTISNANRLVHYYTTFLNNDNVVIDLDEHSAYKWVNIYNLKDMQLAFNQLDILVDVSLKAKKVMSYCILKQAFNQGKISEDEFLKVLQSKNTKE